MVCPSCSTQHSDPFKFCPECGQRLEAAAPAAASDGAAASASTPIARVDEAAQAARLLEQAFDQYDAGKYDEALGSCQAAIALDPSGSTAHSLLGMIYERLGKTAEAVQQYQLVLRMNPDSIADAIKLDTLVNGQAGAARRGFSGLVGWGKRMPVVAGALVAAVVLLLGGWATTRAVGHSPTSARRLSLRTPTGPVPALRCRPRLQRRPSRLARRRAPRRLPHLHLPLLRRRWAQPRRARCPRRRPRMRSRACAAPIRPEPGRRAAAP